jgi:multidrug resistance efflux pump
MKYLNPFYITFIVIGLSLFLFTGEDNTQTISFFGFAETNETEINYNHPIVVDDIFVRPGQPVKANDPLMKISRIKSKEILQDQIFKIKELEADAIAWRKDKQDKIQILESERNMKLSSIDASISSLRSELAYKKSLAEGLQSVEIEQPSYHPIQERIGAKLLDRKLLEDSYIKKEEAIRNELSLGENPYRVQIDRLKAEIEFDEDQKVQTFTVSAPTDGLIGSISCKEAEHVQAYNTLLSFYEPNPSVVRGYVHEDLKINVKKGSKFKVKSLHDPNVTYDGTVIGLGSRIVEIPTRLRKMPDFKTYGREISISIPVENILLQKEKVSIDLIAP